MKYKIHILKEDSSIYQSKWEPWCRLSINRQNSWDNVYHVAFQNALIIFILLIIESKIYEAYHVANLEEDTQQ